MVSLATREWIKKTLFTICPPLRPFATAWRARQTERRFEAHQEHYRLLRRAPRVLPQARDARRPGEIHTFALIPMLSWHAALLPDLKRLGPVSHFDFEQREDSGRAFLAWRRELNARVLLKFEESHARQPVDWLFAYVRGKHILAETIRTIRDRFGVPTVNMGLDDKQAWWHPPEEGQISGSQGIAAAFDLWWTTSPETAEWVNAEGGHGVYLAEGCDADSFPDGELPFAIPVSFVGAAYGPRPRMIRTLRNHGVPVQAFGPGWGKDSAVSTARMNEIFRTSQISLGHGGAGYSERLLNLKGRDFDIPCAGGGAYLTTFNPDLSRHWQIGEEILCWHDPGEMLELVRSWLKEPDRCRQMARRARARCLREHRWIHRYTALLDALGILSRTGQVT